MRLNYYYNFKNTIRFFMNIENMDFSNVDKNKHSWSAPFNFRIRKDSSSFRTLKIPNIYNFKAAYEYYKTQLSKYGLDFEKLEELDRSKRMRIDYDLGEFKEKSYDEWQVIDYNLLIQYDILIRCDIKSFYENIYTHYILNDLTNDEKIDKPLSHLNNGRTGGIIMGNYISLYMAELLSKKISQKFKDKLKSVNIDCFFSYFSDDFYIFCSKDNKEKVLDLFDETLEEYSLNRNENKVNTFDYLEYTNDDKIEKYWKIITSKCKLQQYNQLKKIEKGELVYDNNLFFTNQLIYRLNKIADYKKQKVFIVNFFKSEFFRKTNFKKTNFAPYNYHQLLYLIKKFPEIVLYIDNIIDSFEAFKSSSFKETALNFFNNSLLSNYHDEQLYFFYLLYKIDSFEFLKNNLKPKSILISKNSLLISYFIKYKLFDQQTINELKALKNEDYWLAFYYLILNDEKLYTDLENSVVNYLIPATAKRNLKEQYKKFYENNLIRKNEILVNLDNVKVELNEYFKVKDKRAPKSAEETEKILYL